MHAAQSTWASAVEVADFLSIAIYVVKQCCILVERGQDVVKPQNCGDMLIEGILLTVCGFFLVIVMTILMRFIFLFLPLPFRLTFNCSQPVRETCNQFGVT